MTSICPSLPRIGFRICSLSAKPWSRLITSKTLFKTSLLRRYGGRLWCRRSSPYLSLRNYLSSLTILWTKQFIKTALCWINGFRESTSKLKNYLKKSTKQRRGAQHASFGVEVKKCLVIKQQKLLEFQKKATRRKKEEINALLAKVSGEPIKDLSRLPRALTKEWVDVRF